MIEMAPSRSSTTTVLKRPAISVCPFRTTCPSRGASLCLFPRSCHYVQVVKGYQEVSSAGLQVSSLVADMAVGANGIRGGAGHAPYTAANRSIDGQDVVVWHTFGANHVPQFVERGLGGSSRSRAGSAY